MRIRPYQPADAAPLASIHRTGDPSSTQTAASFDHFMKRLTAAGDRAWVIARDARLVGYVAISPIPALDGVFNLEGSIAPAYRRQRLGSQLLSHLLTEIHGSQVKQLSHSVTHLDSPAAHFLRRHHFFLEHEEWLLTRPSLAYLPPVPQAQLRGYSRKSAIHRFCSLYRQSFAGFPWYQPYTPAEVSATLDSAADILFLFKDGHPIGFVWLRQPEPGVGEIEPIGVAKAHQGQGHGRTLLLAALHRLAARGVEQVNVGAWRANQRAIHLYQSLGFQHTQTLSYLAFNLAG